MRFLLLFLAACAAAPETLATPAPPVAIDVVFPSATGGVIDATFELPAEPVVAGMRVTVGNGPADRVEPGEALKLRVPVPADGVLRFQVNGRAVLAAAAPGTRLHVTTHAMSDEWTAWTASPSSWEAHARCVPESETCTADEVDEPSSMDDTACPGETHRFCMKAPRVRLGRGGKEAVFARGAHDEDDQAVTAEGVPLHVHHCALPVVVFGDEPVILLAEYGQEWTVFRAADGTISATVGEVAR